MNILKHYIIGILSILSLNGCQEKNSNKVTERNKVEFNQDLADTLKRMAEVDQIAAYVRQGAYKDFSDAEWSAFKDSVFTTHEKKLQEIFKLHGFVGYDVAGEEGSLNFWLMVQHSDHNPDFQEKVLAAMEIEVANENANPSNFGLLVDRVRLNTGRAQVYGTQVTYNKHTGQAYPRKLGDSAGVNERRQSIGLQPLEEYLNDMSTMHFNMNKKYMEENGIYEPKLYKVDQMQK